MLTFTICSGIAESMATETRVAGSFNAVPNEESCSDHRKESFRRSPGTDCLWFSRR